MESYDENSCIEFQLTDECDNVHDIRPGGADGSAGDGIYSGKTTLDVIEYIRQLFCDKPLDLKAFRTLFHFIFKTLDDHCTKIKNIACQYSLTTVAADEQIEGILVKITGPNGCRTGIVPFPSSYNSVAVTNLYVSDGEELTSTLPVNHTFNAGSLVPDTATTFIIRAFLEADSSNIGPDTVGVSMKINGQVIAPAETGGPSGSGDNQWAADFHIPRNNGDIITTEVILDYDSGNQGSYQAFTKLVGYF